jgi:hypothetical protein
MDKSTYYPALIQRILTGYVELTNLHSRSDIEQFLIVDEAKAHYIWMNLGWQKAERRSSNRYDSICEDSRSQILDRRRPD